MISLLVDLRVDPTHRDEFLAAITQNARATIRDEPGCFRFDVVEDTAEPNHFLFYEVYRDQEAFADHKRAPHFADWGRARDAYVLEQRNMFGDHVVSLDAAGE